MATHNFNVDRDDSEYNPKMFELISEYLQPRATVFIGDATRRICKTTPLQPTDAIHTDIEGFTFIVLEIVSQLVYDSEQLKRLSDLVLEVSRSELLEPQGSEDGVPVADSGFTHFHNKIYGWLPPSCGSDHEGIQSGLSMGVFLARLYTGGFFSGPLNAVAILRCALEEASLQDINPTEKIVDAIPWILCAGQQLYCDIVRYPSKELRAAVRSLRAGRLYEATATADEKPSLPSFISDNRSYAPPFGDRRWKFWRDRIFEATSNPKLDSQVKCLAIKAVELMDVIQKTSLDLTL